MGKYKYTIRTKNFDPQEVESPDGWKDDESLFPRSDTYKGIFRKFSANTLKFHGDGANFLRKIYNQTSFESEATFTVTETDFDNYSEFERFTGAFDFITYKDSRTNDGDSIEINVIDSSFWNTIKNREKIDVQLNKLISLNGRQLVGFSTEEQFATIPAVPKFIRGILTVPYGKNPIGVHCVSLQLTTTEDNDVKSVTNDTGIQVVEGAFYVASQDLQQTIRIEYDTNFLLTSRSLKVVLQLDRYDVNGIRQESIKVKEVSGIAGQIVRLVSYSDVVVDLIKGDYLILKIVGQGEFYESMEAQTPYNCYVVTKTTTDEIPEANISGMMVHEAFTRILQIYTGENKPLYSEIIGRKDSQPVSYASNGKLSTLMITNGERIRGFSRTESPITISLTNLFSSLYSISPIGMGIERINGVETIRVEDIKYFFDDRIVLTLEEVSNIEKTPMPENIYNKISVGYTKAEYEETNGRYEFNQKSEFSTPIEVVETEYKSVSQVRADNNAIYNSRIKNAKDFPSEDTRYDTDNFFIQMSLGDEENKILNGKFDNWSDDNHPDDWYVFPESPLLRRYLLNSNMCQLLPNPNFYDKGSIRHDIDITAGEKISLQFDYEFIYSGVNPAFAHGGYISFVLTDGSTTYLYDSISDKWVLGGTFNPLWFAVGLAAKDEIQLQNLRTFSWKTMDPAPISGTLRIVWIVDGGMVLDNVFSSGVPKYEAKLTQGYELVENAPYGESSLNLDISPARNIRNHGSMIRAGLELRLNQFISFNTSDKKSTLITKKIGEEVIAEDADILIDSLDEPFLKPVKYEFECKVGRDLIDTLNGTFGGETKPKYLGIIKFRQSNEEYKYVWLMDVQTGGEKGKGKVIGIEVNTNYINPI